MRPDDDKTLLCRRPPSGEQGLCGRMKADCSHLPNLRTIPFVRYVSWPIKLCTICNVGSASCTPRQDAIDSGAEVVVSSTAPSAVFGAQERMLMEQLNTATQKNSPISGAVLAAAGKVDVPSPPRISRRVLWC